MITLRHDRIDRAIPLQYVVMMNRNGWIKGNPELTKTAIKLCELHYMTEGQK